MNTLELIKDSCLFGGTVPKERTEEVRTFLDNLEKQCDIHVVSQQREQLKICDCDEPKPDIMTDSYCLTCLGSTN